MSQFGLPDSNDNVLEEGNKLTSISNRVCVCVCVCVCGERQRERGEKRRGEKKERGRIWRWRE